MLLKAKNISPDLFAQYTSRMPAGLKVTSDYYNALNASDVCVVASGTATLETGIMGKPMVVIYRTSWLTWLIAKAVIRIPYIALVNIVAGKKAAEELLQHNASPKKIAAALAGLIQNPERARAIRRDLAGLKARLGSPGASHRAAKIILEEI